jgi:hypothetical protein
MVSPEFSAGNETQRLADKNRYAAEVIGNTATVFDADGADMIMRNLAVITDRLSPAQFDALSDSTRHQIGVVSFIAQEAAPQTDGDRVRHQDESDEDYRYRTNIYGPLHALQAKIHSKKFDPNDAYTVSKLRFAVTGAGHAFASALTESIAIPVIDETQRYFWGNTNAAVKVADRLTPPEAEEEVG